MFFIPYGTDTPIYYWPFATIALIVVNVVAYPIQMSLPSTETRQIEIRVDDAMGQDVLILEQPVPGWWYYALSFGEGLHPVQWLTSFFMHADIMHLLGNMIFLWVFGLVIEGKVGPLLFPLLYLSVGIIDNALKQVLFLGAPGPPALGASGAIYGMMMMCMLFAPKDNLLSFALIFFRPYFFGVPILIFAIFYFMWDFGFAMMAGFNMGTPFLHVMGGLVGLVAGFIMLRQQWVDCDNEDLFSLIREAAGMKPKKKKLSKKQIAQREEAKEQAKIDHQQSIEVAWRSIDTHFAAENIPAMQAVYARLRHRAPEQQWDEHRLLKIIKYLMQKKEWDRVVEFSNQYFELYPGRNPSVRINVAKIYLIEKAFPRKALKILQPLNQNQLNAQQLKVCQQIVNRAQAMIADGALEFGDEV